MQLSIDDLLAATQTIAGEARTEPFEGQVAIGAVLLNRLSRRDYFKSDSIWEVCHKSFQFSFWNNAADRNLETVMKMHLGEPEMITAMRAFLTAVEGADPSNGADHYFAKYIDPPNWADPSKFTVEIGSHNFYRLA